MFQISQQQLDDVGHEGLLHALSQHWRRSHPQVLGVLPEAERRHLAARAVACADQQGILAERDLFTWCDLCIAARTEFASALGDLPHGQPHG